MDGQSERNNTELRGAVLDRMECLEGWSDDHQMLARTWQKLDDVDNDEK